jgi:hypothetical protein
LHHDVTNDTLSSSDLVVLMSSARVAKSPCSALTEVWIHQPGSYVRHEAVVRLLLDRGADVDAKEKDRRTALMVAVGSGHEAVVQLLKSAGAS